MIFFPLFSAAEAEAAEVVMLNDPQEWKNGEATTAHPRYAEKESEPTAEEVAASEKKAMAEEEERPEPTAEEVAASKKKAMPEESDSAASERAAEESAAGELSDEAAELLRVKSTAEKPGYDDEGVQDKDAEPGPGEMPESPPPPPLTISQKGVPTIVEDEESTETPSEEEPSIPAEATESEKRSDYQGLPRSDLTWKTAEDKKSQAMMAREVEEDPEEDAMINNAENVIGVAPIPSSPPPEKNTVDVGPNSAKKGVDEATGTTDISPPPPTQIQKSINDMYAAGKDLLKDKPADPAAPKKDDNVGGTIKAAKAVFGVHGMSWHYDANADAGDALKVGSETEQTRKFNSGEDKRGYVAPTITTVAILPDAVESEAKKRLIEKKKKLIQKRKQQREADAKVAKQIIEEAAKAGKAGKAWKGQKAGDAEEAVAGKAEEAEKEGVEVLPGLAASPCHNGLEGC